MGQSELGRMAGLVQMEGSDGTVRARVDVQPSNGYETGAEWREMDSAHPFPGCPWLLCLRELCISPSTSLMDEVSKGGKSIH